MKIRSSIICFTIVVAALIALLLWRGKNQPAPHKEDTLTAITDAQSQTATQSIQSTKSLTPVTSNGITTSAQPKPPAVTDQVGLLKGILQANDADIIFYGRLRDQLGHAVENAGIDFSIQYENANARGIQRGTVLSDGNGDFTISGFRGATLGIMPKKEGYALATNGTSFRYSRITPGYHMPDPNNPIIIPMWKLHGAEPLEGINKTFKLQYTAAPINFDFLAGQVVTNGGDLQITVSRPSGIISGRNPQSWSIQIQIIGGGLIATSPEELQITYLAPENGYQPEGNFVNNNGIDTLDRMFFVQSRNGQVYSKIHLLVHINNMPDGFMDISLNGVANTNSSRNWEASVPQ
jgi:hypothetical protein